MNKHLIPYTLLLTITLLLAFVTLDLRNKVRLQADIISKWEEKEQRRRDIEFSAYRLVDDRLHRTRQKLLEAEKSLRANPDN
ncbi:hypothetical protein AAFN60_01925 [Roseibacillus persicicus]|uniref:hypothetical protein n=1 Tax=Roseibacillus persicicus TaxID=454148 RepID=UPI00398BB354